MRGGGRRFDLAISFTVFQQPLRGQKPQKEERSETPIPLKSNRMVRNKGNIMCGKRIYIPRREAKKIKDHKQNRKSGNEEDKADGIEKGERLRHRGMQEPIVLVYSGRQPHYGH